MADDTFRGIITYILFGGVAASHVWNTYGYVWGAAILAALAIGLVIVVVHQSETALV
jgi:acyl-CoA reductase-like NAD-dependent aldehyde dehydrogenase